MIIDCIADLHGEYPKLEGGDLLIVTGDLTASDRAFQFVEFFLWLDKQPYRKKVLIAGNHDQLLQDIVPTPDSLPENIGYLCDSRSEFEGLKIWGSPWSLWFEGINPHCTAFTGSEKELAAKFALIPDDVDILITHTPPYDILDESKRGENCGSKELLKAVLKVKPHLHVFGHIHERGEQVLKIGNTQFVNCSIMNEEYDAVNKPVRIEL